MTAQPRGSIKIDAEECKGCGLCVESCPPKCLEMSSGMNLYGARPAHYRGEGCTGCGICFYCCPEPGAITVYRTRMQKVASAAEEEAHAATV